MYEITQINKKAFLARSRSSLSARDKSTNTTTAIENDNDEPTIVDDEIDNNVPAVRMFESFESSNNQQHQHHHDNDSDSNHHNHNHNHHTSSTEATQSQMPLINQHSSPQGFEFHC